MIRLGSELVRTINPFYEPANPRSPSPDIAVSAAGNDAHGPVSHLLQATALATRVVAAYTNLPAEINNLLGYLASLSVVGRFANDQFNDCAAWMLPGTHRENTLDVTGKNTKEKNGETSQNPRPQPNRLRTTTRQTGQLPDTALALGALVGLSVVGASSASVSDSGINVMARTLDKICHDATYPCHKTYRLTEDIDASQLKRSIGNKTHGFTGHLNGDNHTISNLPRCLVHNLTGNGSITNLRFMKANIKSDDTAGVAACEMSGNAMVKNIHAECAQINTTGDIAAIGVGRVTGNGTVARITAEKCEVIASSIAGIGAGYLSGGSVTNTVATDCRVEIKESSKNAGAAGIGAGRSDGGNVTHTTACNCTVTTTDNDPDVGSDAGIGAGCNVQGYVTNTTAINCRVKTSGVQADAGIGAGESQEGTVSHTTALNCTVKTTKKDADAGIGAGNNSNGNVHHTTAMKCRVETSGNQADAGIGAGEHRGTGTIANTIARNCLVSNNGTEAEAGIGAGFVYEGSEFIIAGTRVMASNVTSPRGKAAISGGTDQVICNVRVKNGRNLNLAGNGCETWRKESYRPCANIAPGLITPKCRMVNYGFDHCSNARPTCPIPKTVVTEPGATFSRPDRVATSTPPTATATVTNTTLSSLNSAATSTPPVPWLNATTKAFIALGTVIVVLVGVIGVIACRYYRHRSSTNAGRNQPMRGGQPRNNRQLCTHQDHFLLSSVRQENIRPRSTSPLDHYQPLFGPGNRVLRHPSFENRYQQLVFKQENPASLMADTEPAPGLHHTPCDSPVYQELDEFEYINNRGEPVANGQAGT